MQSGQLISVRTNPATQFLGALAQNAALTLNLTMPITGAIQADGYVDAGLAAGNAVRSRLRSIWIASMENLAWEVWLWASDAFAASPTNPALVFPLGRWTFVANDGVRIGGTGLYYYYIEGLDHAYADFDDTGEIHLMLVNRSAAAKSADAAGAILIQMQFEPTGNY
jgi:hypothetical protein